jgi:hypothetical protein
MVHYLAYYIHTKITFADKVPCRKRIYLGNKIAYHFIKASLIYLEKLYGSCP